MWRSKKFLVVALLAVVVLLASTAGVALAADNGDDSEPEAKYEALENYLQSLVEQEKITQAQADEYLNWWQSKPDVPLQFGFHGHGGFRGMGGMRGFGWPCPPTE